ncbi:hypothetical protein OUZ56_002693 [Daphnia magna]|uniref:Uncharacterized protein n=1 Tax=Daphnia magna TaxID=35525 RepID=A0ABR0A6L1_9CRUS|nr:hypothetical protein OUZ56_002693 [Daphnia magna]
MTSFALRNGGGSLAPIRLDSSLSLSLSLLFSFPPVSRGFDLAFSRTFVRRIKKNQRFLLSSHSLLAPVLDALATERFIVTTFRKIQKRDVIKTNIYPSLTKKKKNEEEEETCCIYAAFNFLAVLAADTVQRPFDRSSGPKAENLVGACCCSLIISSGPRGRE